MPTALDLFWDLSQPVKEQRLDASAKLVNALQLFQQSHLNQLELSASEAQDILSLDALNAHDVAYALKRLVRGLASPRESSRLGFAVALTELLSRLETVTSSQMMDLVLSSSEITGSLNGQEERDMLFSRLFGLTTICQSGLITRETPLLHTSNPASTLQDYQRLVTELMSLGEAKSWFRESCWWSIVQAIAHLSQSSASFKSQALEWTFNSLFIQTTEWTPEKVGVWLRFHSLWEPNASLPLRLVFKGKHILSPASLPQLALILKDIELDEEERSKHTSHGIWKVNPHFVWPIIFETYFKGEKVSQTDIAPFKDFYKVVIDESIFSATSSPERKYTGFQLIELALKEAPDSSKPHLFTKNFIRTWINQLSKKDRYLHKAALKLASTVHRVVRESPSSGFPLVVQLLGPNGSRDFDRITNTKTVEVILSNMSEAQLTEYVQYLVNVFQDASNLDKQSIDSEQRWTLEQLASLIRSTTVPKSDSWVTLILNHYIRHGFFAGNTRKSKKQVEVSETIRSLCRAKLSSALAELSSQNIAQHNDMKTAKFHGRTSTGSYWVVEVVKAFKSMEKDALQPVFDTEEDIATLREKARSVIMALDEVSGDSREESQGAILLIGSILLQTYDAVTEDSEGTAAPVLEDCLQSFTRMFDLAPKSPKKKKKATALADKENEKEQYKPIDVVVDILIGYLENSNALMRAISGQVFAALCSRVEESTVELLLQQIQRRNVLPEPSSENEDDSMEDSDGEETGSNSGLGSDDEVQNESEGTSEDGSDEDEGDVDPEFRKKIADALGAIGIKEHDEDSEDSSDIVMDDDQMMQLDDKLADIFRAQSTANKGKIEAGLQREATHFKIRVLDLLDTFARKCPGNPQVPRLLLPLIQVIMEASTDEQQLMDKTNGIIRKRIGVSQIIPEKEVDVTALSTDLEEIHNIARKASHQKIPPSTLSTANIYLSRTLAHNQGLDAVTRLHRGSLDDFMTKKGSKINHVFFADFINRIPSAAWEIRQELIEACTSGSSVNAYRQMQAIQWLNALLPHAIQMSPAKEDILTSISLIREATYSSLLNAANGKQSLTVAQAKAVVKLALHALRIHARIDPTSLQEIWDQEKCTTIVAEVKKSDSIANDPGLIALLNQMITKVDLQQEEENVVPVESKKRKADAVETPKSRKKFKKHKKANAS